MPAYNPITTVIAGKSYLLMFLSKNTLQTFLKHEQINIINQQNNSNRKNQP